MQGLSGPAVTLVDHEYNTEVSRKQLSGPIFSKQKNGVRNLNSIDPSKITNTLPGKKMNSETSESRVEGGQDPCPLQNNRNMNMLSISFLLIVLCIRYHIRLCGLSGNNSGEKEEAPPSVREKERGRQVEKRSAGRQAINQQSTSCKFAGAAVDCEFSRMHMHVLFLGAEFVCRPRNAHVQAHRHVAKFPQTQRLCTRLAFKNMMNKVRDVIEEPENQRAQGDSLPDAVSSERLWLLPGPLHGSSASGPCKAVGDTPGSHGRALCGYSSEPVIPGAGFPQTLREASSVCTAKMGHGATLPPPPCRQHRGAAGVAAGAFGRSPAPSDWEKMVSVLKGVLTGCDPAVGLFLLYLDESNAPEEVDH
ncbi:hypothetical protein MJG53_018489 [Ovis ammon polii x Ovis aries]|uniref:Uncharacterized protein n=1 Tax=Ovis ammon polii x Ovis aries TaxID=2918886 RepID=A0ACB9U3W7_9CETA|nr:hypothetical protein MJG53_018489 [Ovis ammon polii x Ovis aries]